MAVIIAGQRVIDADGDRTGAWLRIDGGVIAEIGAGDAPDGAVKGAIVLPGFVDLHCHGGGGGSFTSAEADQIETAIATHLAHGTTTMHASLVSAEYDDLIAQIQALIPFVDSGAVAGIHLEGPWISRSYCGAHDPATLRTPETVDVQRVLDAGAGRISMVTIAPELPGALGAIEMIVERGAIAAVGHTAADGDVTRAAIDSGATVATHVFNAMPPLLHRDIGPVGVLLADPRVTCEVIADGVHLDPDVVALTLAAASGRGALVTDAMSAAGAGDGNYRVGSLDVVVRDGVARLRDGDSLAGSTLLMDSAWRRAVGLADRSPSEASAAASLAPARAMGLTDRGRIAVGQRADLVVLDEELQAVRVMRAGEWV
ncbi:MAG: N-acetylglucosamine-6-phosphate deacetylase [Actinomycetota bacterium]|jgi:N-acetylglucosamine-6-phosphate deacetylase